MTVEKSVIPEEGPPGNASVSRICVLQVPESFRRPPWGQAGGLVYQRKSGTSMAAPVVSGAAALLLEKYPDLTNVEVKIRMKESAEDLGLPKNWQGWGRIHIGRLTR